MEGLQDSAAWSVACPSRVLCGKAAYVLLDTLKLYTRAHGAKVSLSGFPICGTLLTREK